MLETSKKDKEAIAEASRDSPLNARQEQSKKPRLEARWDIENGKLICKWLRCENEFFE
jgi:hypothetical protein